MCASSDHHLSLPSLSIFAYINIIFSTFVTQGQSPDSQDSIYELTLFAPLFLPILASMPRAITICLSAALYIASLQACNKAIPIVSQGNPPATPDVVGIHLC